MIESVMLMDGSFFDTCHGFIVFFFPGFIGQPGIAKGHLQAAVPQQLLQTLQAHAGI